jgi:hypothetical protein
MALYNLGQIKSQIAQYAGVRNTLGQYGFDDSTFPTEDLTNNIVNDSFREICGEWDYTFLETTRSYPFYHVISGVQSITGIASGTYIGGPFFQSGVSVTPYPNDVLNFAWTAENSVDDVTNHFSGVHCLITVAPGINVGGVMISGDITYNNWSGVGYNYQLSNDIDKFYVPGVFIPHSNNGLSANGILVKNIDYEDMVRIFPIGTIQASGTPIYFSEAPGLSPNINGKSIVFGPTPVTSQYSGNNFITFYKKKHVDLVDDNDVQSVIPDMWQNAVIKLATAKVFQIADPSRADATLREASGLIRSMKLWDAKQPSKVRRFRDSTYDTNSSFIFDNSSWFTLGGSGR